jgi:thiaminase/transcriptional activator TenA
MGLSDDLRASVDSIWEQVATHPFVIELGDNTLSSNVFNTYFDQDYLFLKDWSALLCLAAAKAPDFGAARHLVGFLHLTLSGEEGLFQQAFKERGLSLEEVANLEYRPTTRHYSGYLRGLAYQGTFVQLVTVLLGIEWPYLDWAQRLQSAGKRPANPYYQGWIDVHASQEMADFVGWQRETVDKAVLTPADRSSLFGIFQDVLRYELLFWDMAYRGDTWPS